MKKLLLVLVLLAATLTGCSEKLYDMPGVVVIEKPEPEHVFRGGLRYSVVIEKDGNKYTFEVDGDSYKLANEGSTVDLTYSDNVFGEKSAKLTPVGVNREK